MLEDGKVLLGFNELGLLDEGAKVLGTLDDIAVV